MKGLFGFLIALVLASLGQIAPAFAQDTAATSPKLTSAELNRYLASYLAGARAALGEGAEGSATCLTQDQKRWELEVRKPCGTDEGCQRRVLLERLAALDALQPGASRITAFRLPKAPVLVTALPPAQQAGGRAAAGLVADTPFAVTGHLVHESADAEKMGLAIRSAAGRSAVLVPDMDIGNSPTHAALQTAMRSDPKANYRAEGTLDPATGGLALSQCLFVYRLPD